MPKCKLRRHQSKTLRHREVRPCRGGRPPDFECRRANCEDTRMRCVSDGRGGRFISNWDWRNCQRRDRKLISNFEVRIAKWLERKAGANVRGRWSGYEDNCGFRNATFEEVGDWVIVNSEMRSSKMPEGIARGHFEFRNANFEDPRGECTSDDRGGRLITNCEVRIVKTSENSAGSLRITNCRWRSRRDGILIANDEMRVPKLSEEKP